MCLVDHTAHLRPNGACEHSLASSFACGAVRGRPIGPSLATSRPGGPKVLSVPSAQKLPGRSTFVHAQNSSSRYSSSEQGHLKLKTFVGYCTALSLTNKDQEYGSLPVYLHALLLKHKGRVLNYRVLFVVGLCND
jgi:hypothetical protein